MNVVHLGKYRDLLRDWDEVRERIIKGKIHGWAITVRDDLSREAIYLGGTFKADEGAAFRAGMAQSWEMTKAADAEDDEEPELPRLEFANSRQ